MLQLISPCKAPGIIVFAAACLLMASCTKERNDLVEFNTKDKSYTIGLYKSTALMIISEDDHIHRLGVRGFQRIEGRVDKTFFGFECSQEGGIYSTLTEQPNEMDDMVTFDSGSWTRTGDFFIDHVANEACKIGEASLIKD